MLTAERNVELPLLLTKLSKAEREKRVAIALKVVGLADRAKHYPRQLSGGQEQRVGIARAIVTDPTLLLCDEPTGDLDRKAGDEILDLLQALNRDHGKTIVMVTHDPRAAERAKRTLHLEKGLLMEGGARMKFLPLLWSSLWRKKIRTIFTLLVDLRRVPAVRPADDDPHARSRFGVDIAGLDRLVLIHKVSLIMPLPVSYLGAAERRPRASTLASHQTWFGGVYQDPANFFAQMVVEPEPFMKIYPEFKIPPDQMQGVAGRSPGRDRRRRPGEALRLEDRRSHSDHRHDLAAEAGPGLGLQHRRDVRRRSGRRQDAVLLPLRLPRREPPRRRGPGRLVRREDRRSRRRRSEMGAKFDAMFANSSAETKTTTEKGFVEGFAKQIGDIGAIMIAILVAVLFTMLLVAANTMAQSVRERTSEVGVLKTLGFSNGVDPGRWCSANRCSIAVIGGGARPAGWRGCSSSSGDPTGGMLPIFMLPTRDVAVGAVLIVVLGLLAGAAAGRQRDEPEDHRRVEEGLTCSTGSARPSPSRCSTCAPFRSASARRASPSSALPAS